MWWWDQAVLDLAGARETVAATVELYRDKMVKLQVERVILSGWYRSR